MANETWKVNSIFGLYCEQIVFAYLRSIGSTINDITADAEYQAQEIDAIIALPDGLEWGMEAEHICIHKESAR